MKNQDKIKADNQGNDKLQSLIDFFEILYFENSTDEKKSWVNQQVDRIIDNYIAVSGGEDKIVNLKQVQQFSEKALHQIIVAKGDHFLGKEKSEWYEVFPRIASSLLDFINGTYERHYNSSSIKELIGSLLLKNPKCVALIQDVPEKYTFDELKKLANHLSKDDRELFRRYFMRSKAFYPSFTELLSEYKKLSLKTQLTAKTK